MWIISSLIPVVCYRRDRSWKKHWQWRFRRIGVWKAYCMKSWLRNWWGVECAALNVDQSCHLQNDFTDTPKEKIPIPVRVIGARVEVLFAMFGRKSSYNYNVLRRFLPKRSSWLCNINIRDCSRMDNCAPFNVGYNHGVRSNSRSLETKKKLILNGKILI